MKLLLLQKKTTTTNVVVFVLGNLYKCCAFLAPLDKCHDLSQQTEFINYSTSEYLN